MRIVKNWNVNSISVVENCFAVRVRKLSRMDLKYKLSFKNWMDFFILCPFDPFIGLSLSWYEREIYYSLSSIYYNSYQFQWKRTKPFRNQTLNFFSATKLYHKAYWVFLGNFVFWAVSVFLGTLCPFFGDDVIFPSTQFYWIKKSLYLMFLTFYPKSKVAYKNQYSQFLCCPVKCFCECPFTIEHDYSE